MLTIAYGVRIMIIITLGVKATLAMDLTTITPEIA